ncbi:MAG TPA: hypothetical protein PK311_05825 [Syntrophales bacterium]|nr:hypothetical protein [Syntrophales bacterium]HQF75914.1 hypothetical protein [Syntrophales bacterium]HQK48669.1 hypothetical protein [Syntrophales bacterium]
MLKIGKLGFDPATPPTGTWGTYQAGVRLKIRKLTGEALRELRRPYVRTEMELDPRSRRMVPAEKVDAEKLDDALADYLIEDFEGIGDEEGLPLPVDLESKRRIMNQPALAEWVLAFAQSLEVAQAERQRDEIKN